jgi:transcriptional regulator with XRE-family HTH domain
MNLAKRLKHLRENKNLSQRQLAKLLNVAPSTLAMYEVDKREPDFDTLKKIANFFSVSTDYLLGISDNPSRSTTPKPQSVEEQIMAMLHLYDDLTEEEKKMLAEDMADYFEYRRAKLRGRNN